MAIQTPERRLQRQPERRLRADARSDAAIRHRLQHNDNRNLGIGQWDRRGARLSRARATTAQFRVQQIGPLGRRAFLRTRLQYSWTDSESRSAVEAPTIRVNDAFTRGGAQVAGGQHSRTLIVRLRSRLRPRQPHAAHRRADRRRALALGRHSRTISAPTRSKASTAFDAGPAAQLHAAHRRSEHRLHNFQGAFYVQDDMRVRRNLTLSAGVRYEAQTHVDDFNNVMPRFGVTWAPGTARPDDAASELGHFLRLAVDEHLRADAARRRLPAAGDRHRQSAVSRSSPTRVARRRAGQPVRARRRLRAAAVDAREPRHRSARYKQLQASATYAYTRGGALARGVNLNAPVNGVRPDRGSATSSRSCRTRARASISCRPTSPPTRARCCR